MQVDIDTAGVTFGRRIVFEGVSASVPNATVATLVGPSGSGKSTLLAAIAGAQRLTSGHIRFGGGMPTPRQPPVTWIAQGAHSLGRRTILDNVLLGPLGDGPPWTLARQKSLEAIALVGLEGRHDQLAHELSGGELQRVAFARGLSSAKSIILADEPTANLDEANTANVTQLLVDLAGTATIIVATHDPYVIAAVPQTVRLRGKP